MGVDIDEARRDGEPSRIDLLFPLRGKARPDLGNATGAERDVELATGCAESVEEGAVANDEIVIGAAPREWQRGNSQHCAGCADEGPAICHAMILLFDA